MSALAAIERPIDRWWGERLHVGLLGGLLDDGAAEVGPVDVGAATRAMDELLWQLADVQPGERALEVGCGRGALCRAKGIAGSDKAAWRRPPVVARTEQLPFADGTFDVVLAQETLIYCLPIGAALDEIRRVLRPDLGKGGGRLVFGEVFAGDHAALFHAPIGGDLDLWLQRFTLSRLTVELVADLSAEAERFYGLLLGRVPASDSGWRLNLVRRIALLRSGEIRRVIGVARVVEGPWHPPRPTASRRCAPAGGCHG